MISKVSTRALVLGAVLFSLSYSPVFAAPSGDGEPGDSITSPSDPTSTSGGAGDGGFSEHPNGYDGGAGGEINVTINGGGTASSSPPEGVRYTSTGGDGGSGNDGFGHCYGNCAGNPEDVGNGGKGGDGGNVRVSLQDGTVYGDLSATSQGGKGGRAGETNNVGNNSNGPENGAAGNGGDVTIKVATTGVVIGDVVAKSLGGEGQGQDRDGHGGDVNVTISGIVTGGVRTSSEGDMNNAGVIKVAISGGVVSGIISANTEGPSTLSFKFQISDRSEFNAATQALTGPGAGGQVTINGNLYRWEGFSTLVDLLSYVGPNDEVKVTVQRQGEPASVNSTPDPVAPQTKASAPAQIAKVFGEIPLVTGKPEMAKCSGATEVRTVRQNDGSIVVIHHSRGEDTLIGQLKDGQFRRTSAAQDWDVKVGDSGKSVDVTNGGAAVSSCAFS